MPQFLSSNILPMLQYVGLSSLNFSPSCVDVCGIHLYLCITLPHYSYMCMEYKVLESTDFFFFGIYIYLYEYIQT